MPYTSTEIGTYVNPIMVSYKFDNVSLASAADITNARFVGPDGLKGRVLGVSAIARAAVTFTTEGDTVPVHLNITIDSDDFSLFTVNVGATEVNTAVNTSDGNYGVELPADSIIKLTIAGDTDDTLAETDSAIDIVIVVGWFEGV